MDDDPAEDQLGLLDAAAAGPDGGGAGEDGREGVARDDEAQVRVEPALPGAEEPGIARADDAFEDEGVEGDGGACPFRRGPRAGRHQPVRSDFPAVFPAFLPGSALRALQPIEDDREAEPSPRYAVLVVIPRGVSEDARFHGGAVLVVGRRHSLSCVSPRRIARSAGS
jgi:hypothetical protein